MQPTLLVLAAGIGSRYGGLKQIDPVGPHGETIIDYDIYDAARAGFGRVVFVIRRDIEAAFRQHIGNRVERRLPVEYAFQQVAAGRQKPWGTGEAILVAEPHIQEPFAVINADDFYGARSFQLLADHLRAAGPDFAMVGFVLRNTLSEHGHVSRGVCTTDPAGYLTSIVEHTHITANGHGAQCADGTRLSGDELVSMNMWGFTPGLFPHLHRLFTEFVAQHQTDPKAEFYIPTVINHLIVTGQARVKVLRTPDRWFGVTYQQDKPAIAAAIRQLIARGEYPSTL